jgi:hypothetical protein
MNQRTKLYDCKKQSQKHQIALEGQIVQEHRKSIFKAFMSGKFAGGQFIAAHRSHTIGSPIESISKVPNMKTDFKSFFGPHITLPLAPKNMAHLALRNKKSHRMPEWLVRAVSQGMTPKNLDDYRRSGWPVISIAQMLNLEVKGVEEALERWEIE